MMNLSRGVMARLGDVVTLEGMRVLGILKMIGMSFKAFFAREESVKDLNATLRRFMLTLSMNLARNFPLT